MVCPRQGSGLLEAAVKVHLVPGDNLVANHHPGPTPARLQGHSCDRAFDGLWLSERCPVTYSGIFCIEGFQPQQRRTSRRLFRSGDLHSTTSPKQNSTLRVMSRIGITILANARWTTRPVQQVISCAGRKLVFRRFCYLYICWRTCIDRWSSRLDIGLIQPRDTVTWIDGHAAERWLKRVESDNWEANKRTFEGQRVGITAGDTTGGDWGEEPGDNDVTSTAKPLTLRGWRSRSIRWTVLWTVFTGTILYW